MRCSVVGFLSKPCGNKKCLFRISQILPPPTPIPLRGALCRSEGFPLTCYLIPVRDGAGVWTFGNLPLPAFKQETRMFLKHTKRTIFLKQVIFLRTKKPLRERT